MSEPITVFRLPALLLGVALNFCPGQQLFPLASTFLTLLDRLCLSFVTCTARVNTRLVRRSPGSLSRVGFHLLKVLVVALV